MKPSSLIWSLVAVTGVLDVVLFAALGMTATMNLAVVIFLAGLWGGARLIERRNPPAGRLAEAFVQILAFAQVGSYLTYGAMAASPFPIADGLLERVDALLGFDWLAWFNWVHAHPIVHLVLAKAYASIPLQLLVLLVYFSFADADRVDELVLATILAVAIIVPGMVLLPAIGEWSQHGVGIEPWRADILALRSHTMQTVSRTLGIVAFPSFHTVAGVLLTNMARGRKWFLPVLALNVLMIVSVMSEGAHFAVDMLSGLVIAWVAIAASRSILVWCKRGSPVRGTVTVAPTPASAFQTVAIGS
jgi:membrane-associated phospholipid phosphatase